MNERDSVTNDELGTRDWVWPVAFLICEDLHSASFSAWAPCGDAFCIFLLYIYQWLRVLSSSKWYVTSWYLRTCSRWFRTPKIGAVGSYLHCYTQTFTHTIFIAHKTCSMDFFPLVLLFFFDYQHPAGHPSPKALIGVRQTSKRPCGVFSRQVGGNGWIYIAEVLIIYVNLCRDLYTPLPNHSGWTVAIVNVSVGNTTVLHIAAVSEVRHQ